MKNRIFALSATAILLTVSCSKEQDKIKSDATQSESSSLAKNDSSAAATISTPENAPAFKITPQIIAAEKGRTVFTQNGSTLFYFDMNANKGVVKIDGHDVELSRADFNENNYSLSGEGVTIQAINGDFKEMVSDCVTGTFPQVKITHGGKTLNLAEVGVQDCPNY